MKRLFTPSIWTTLAACALCIPASLCYATVEPELTTAVRHKDIQRVATLLSEGVKVDERDEGAEQTPLMWAARTGSLAIVQNLLNHGAAVNAKDDFGATALDIALSKKHAQIVKLLTNQGAKTGTGGGAARNSATKREAGRELATSRVGR